MENLNRIKGALADAGKTGVRLAGQLGKDPVTVSKWCTIMGDVLLLGGREIICNWDIDCNVSKYEHIIEQRIERFPDRYKDLEADDLGQKMDNAIEFAKKIAQRNYKFIIPMYYPTAHRIQLLMPIYLETSYTSQPDFALVLTPHANERVYTPETILGLDEVYQDARLVAKPEESWLNPRIIK